MDRIDVVFEMAQEACQALTGTLSHKNMALLRKLLGFIQTIQPNLQAFQSPPDCNVIKPCFILALLPKRRSSSVGRATHS